jgi:hypothetical protein
MKRVLELADLLGLFLDQAARWSCGLVQLHAIDNA